MPHSSAASYGRSFYSGSRLSNIIGGEIDEMGFNATLKNNLFIAKLDPGASHDFMAKDSAIVCGLKISAMDI